uniref:Uncharacterized protein n=2 Tax=Guillardia theta TaxID=55529 RepID=A0A6U5VRX8_GUITH|mmetsp:Transcript_10820/g.36414  ORF Transcript_10820/g.36414 Transcript_10820/m.36414 type:complete len:116 (+) Transcript_10820:265-612(+)
MLKRSISFSFESRDWDEGIDDCQDDSCKNKPPYVRTTIILPTAGEIFANYFGNGDTSLQTHQSPVVCGEGDGIPACLAVRFGLKEDGEMFRIHVAQIRKAMEQDHRLEDVMNRLK